MTVRSSQNWNYNVGKFTLPTTGLSEETKRTSSSLKNKSTNNYYYILTIVLYKKTQRLSITVQWYNVEKVAKNVVMV